MKTRRLFLGILVISVMGCKNQSAVDPELLPKDISEKPIIEDPKIRDQDNLNTIKNQIEDQISHYVCDDPKQWKVSPFGVKPCGGPTSYIAFPLSIEDTINAMIKVYNEKQAAFNKKYDILSDCGVTPAPKSIYCRDGKAMINYTTSIMNTENPN